MKLLMGFSTLVLTVTTALCPQFRRVRLLILMDCQSAFHSSVTQLAVISLHYCHQPTILKDHIGTVGHPAVFVVASVMSAPPVLGAPPIRGPPPVLRPPPLLVK